MPLPIKTPFPPMEALSVEEIPRGPEWQYEPKWDGFRCLVFRDGAKVELQSKAGQPLARYFPEIVETILSLPAKQFVLDGELVIPEEKGLSFDELLLRLHPAESRVRKLAAEHPAMLIVFDLLADGPKSKLTEAPLAERRKALEKFAKQNFGKARIRLSPATRDFAEADKWFSTPGESLDGVIAKRLDYNYRSGDRTGMVKIKPIRSVECVVGGFRYGEKKPVVGSLLLGLYDDAGLLHHVGFTSSIKAAERPALTKKLEKLKGEGFTGRAPGGPSRWSTERSAEWVPLKPELVVEISYDHFTGGRFRHGTKFLRWRPDKAPRQCTLEQVAPRKQQKALELLGL
jgi:ATP-dependent DNA ligase